MNQSNIATSSELLCCRDNSSEYELPSRHLNSFRPYQRDDNHWSLSLSPSIGVSAERSNRRHMIAPKAFSFTFAVVHALPGSGYSFRTARPLLTLADNSPLRHAECSEVGKRVPLPQTTLATTALPLVTSRQKKRPKPEI
jgi:hypothetical protein